MIPTCFVGREIREHTLWCGDPPGPFEHAQNFPDAESVLQLLDLVVECERQVDPGAESDTIIVNNDVGWVKGNRYLAALDGTRTFAGTIKVVTRENYGSSLGGYAHAYELFAGEYEYWTFTEDDILVNGHHYLARCRGILERDERIGFVAIQGLSRIHALHAHGGVGTTHRRVLEAVRRVWGCLPHRARHEGQSDTDHRMWGEVVFTNIIDRLGYQLVVADQEPPLYTFAYDQMQGRHGRPAAPAPSLPQRAARKLARLTGRLAELAG